MTQYYIIVKNINENATIDEKSRHNEIIADNDDDDDDDDADNTKDTQ